MTEASFDRGRVIVAADDYGIRDSSHFILELAGQGKLDRVAVLVNYVSAEEAATLLATGVKIDLHLELIKLVGSGEKIKEGALKRAINFVFRYVFGFVTARKAEAEWRFQIERFKDIFGRLPDGLNSHEHLHYFPRFFSPFLRLAKEYGIGYIRFGEQRMDPDFHRSLVSKVLSVFWKLNRATFQATEGIATSGLFLSYDWLDDPNEIPKMLSETEGTIEIAFHPERKDEYVVVERFF